MTLRKSLLAAAFAAAALSALAACGDAGRQTAAPAGGADSASSADSTSSAGGAASGTSLAMAPPGQMTTDTDETTPWGYLIPAGTPFHIAAAVKSPDRTDAMRERDVNRKPAETLTLAEVAPGDRIVEIASFGQYYTTMLAAAVGPEGRIYMSDLPYTAGRSEGPSRAFVAAHPNTEYQLVDYNDMAFPADLDAVHVVLYYHDLSLNQIDVAAFNRKVFDALRPGGVYFIVDHNARPGSGREDTESVHRIDPQVIRDEVTAAGFVLETDSDLLRHPDDDLGAMVFAPGTRGVTDQSVLVFRKPE